MKKITCSLIATAFMAAGAQSVSAQEFDVTISNLSHGLYFTPVIVAAHSSAGQMFSLGTPASTSLQAMAEGGDITGLEADLTAIGADYVSNPAGGLLAPGASVTTDMINTDASGNMYLSVSAMILPSNDGFIGLDSWKIPTEAGTYKVYLNVYDAGTEANDEVMNPGAGGAPGVAGIPAAPGGDAGANATGVTTTESNTTVHIHRGALGDSDVNGGQSDLSSSTHRWLNPAAMITVTVQ